MKRVQNKQMILIICLIVAMVGLSIGFAAFSKQLTISSSASVSPNPDTFQVKLSSSGTTYSTTAVAPTLSTTANGFTASTGKISEENLAISDLNVTFTEPGQKVTYDFYAYNAGKYEPYLKEVTFNNAANATTHKTCVAGTGADATKVASACEGITYTLTTQSCVNDVGMRTRVYTSTATKINDDCGGFVNKFAPIKIEIEYKSNATRSDGPFTVNFGDVTILYSTVHTNSAPA